MKPNIDEFTGGETIRFTDGSEEEIDVVVYCTGYKISFPFFDEDLISAPDNQIPLYRRVVDPEHPGLYFIGLIQPLGAIMPLAEAQSEWIADVLEAKGRPGGRRRDAPRDRARARADGEALRRLEAPHDPGRLRALHARDPPRAA